MVLNLIGESRAQQACYPVNAYIRKVLGLLPPGCRRQT
jgi:hypothetical protein